MPSSGHKLEMENLHPYLRRSDRKEKEEKKSSVSLALMGPKMMDGQGKKLPRLLTISGSPFNEGKKGDGRL